MTRDARTPSHTLIGAAALALAGFASSVAPAADIATYPLPPIYAESQAYSLTVDGKSVPVVSYVGEYDYAHFSMSNGPALVEIEAKAQAAIRSYHISPRKLNIPAVVQGRKLRFTLQQDEYLIVKVEGLKELVIAADPAETDKPASSGEGIFNVTDSKYAADRGGQRISTQALQRAIDDASAYGSQHGQGTVYVPRGVYLTGNLVLKSNVAMYLEGGAVLRCTAKREDYTPHWRKVSMNADITWFIYTEDHSKNIKLYGRGTIDGNGWNLWENHKKGQRIANNLLVPLHVSGFTLDGLIIRDPSAWSVVPVRSDNLLFTNLKMFCRLNMGENDGIDVVECQDVVVRNAIGIALDDPFSTKTWASDTDIALNWSGQPEKQNNVLIEDTLSWTHCYGYKVGQGVCQDQSNITFRNGVVYDAAIGLGVHHKWGAASASNIVFEDMEVERLHGQNDGKGTWLVLFVEDKGAGGGPVSNVTVRNVRVHDAGETPAMIKGSSESSAIRGVTLDNITMPGASEPARNLHAMNLLIREHYSDVKILPEQVDEPAPRENLAKGAAVKASSSLEFPTSHATDGDMSTRWGSERTDAQWLAVDLGEERRIDGVKIAWEAAYAKAFEIQVSGDGQRWRTVERITNGKGGVQTIDFRPVVARYVRMQGLQRGTKYGYSIYEFEVYAAATNASSSANAR